MLDLSLSGGPSLSTAGRTCDKEIAFIIDQFSKRAASLADSQAAGFRLLDTTPEGAAFTFGNCLRQAVGKYQRAELLLDLPNGAVHPQHVIA